MKNKSTLILTLLFATSAMYAQIGIRGGVNMASELRSFSNEAITSAFQDNNLTGYQVGLVYQFNSKKSGIGFGFETGVLLSQKGGVFKLDKSDVVQSFVKGYHEMNYLEVPLNGRLYYRFGGVVGVFGTAGIYGAYALKGKTVFESDVATLVKEDSFDGFMNRIDYGYSYGGGVEFLKKIQIGFQWSQGLHKRDTDKSILDKITTETGSSVLNLTSKDTSKVFSVTLTYLF